MNKTFTIKGMHCNSCVELIKINLEENKYIKKVTGDYKKEFITVEFDDKKINVEEIVKIVEKEGYKITKAK